MVLAVARSAAWSARFSDGLHSPRDAERPSQRPGLSNGRVTTANTTMQALVARPDEKPWLQVLVQTVTGSSKREPRQSEGRRRPWLTMDV